ncbi:alpha-hydroxy acid oxidase [Photobacterium kishitanii]|uniref:alpha-hydroxy acid oxidase n=1 Tax=Photobacterium kishitanii TaxID=318456 RepID=UPI0027393DC8|nr:alpha-hydroxy-acid oxidizing protein [Photobacterium kishitanii]
MNDYFNTRYPSVDLLRKKAKSRLPKFAFEYVDGGCNNEIGLRRNTDDIRELELIPYYLRDYKDVSLKTTLFGETYDAPFGVSPVGLQGAYVGRKHLRFWQKRLLSITSHLY